MFQQEMEFRFAEEEDPSEYCTRISAKAHHYAPEHGARMRIEFTTASQRVISTSAALAAFSADTHRAINTAVIHTAYCCIPNARDTTPQTSTICGFPGASAPLSRSAGGRLAAHQIRSGGHRPDAAALHPAQLPPGALM